ncbi:MAG: hypothetical protein A7315_13515 [Candidatus Altiarchaeales archaeon WOR_SM1_79]|nr:MAG: hypothetical protein A7315_13515 [Candidatus Altiarchaeales archaeon WOR_SM1_79]
MADKPTGIKICTILFAIYGVIISSFSGVFFIVFVGGPSNDAMPTIISIVFLILGILNFITAYGMWNLKSWARILGIILAVMSLPNIPIGTIIGIVILYFLLIDAKTKEVFK